MHSPQEPITVDVTPNVRESPTAVARPWLLWTGVVGAIFSLLAMVAILALSQKLAAQQEALAQLESTMSQPQALVSALRQEWMDGLTQQQAAQDKVLAQQETLTIKLDALARQKAAGWQLTDAPAIQFMLAQLQASAQLNPDPIRLAYFLQHWQTRLTDAGVAQDHALMQAIVNERNALRSDLPTWLSESESWQQLRVALTNTRLTSNIPQVDKTVADAPADWWQRFSSLVRIRPAGVSDAELAQTLSQRGIWPVQTALALEVVQVGLVTNQPQLVNQASTQLLSLLSEQAPELRIKWQSRLQLWQTWQGIPEPQWHYLHNHIKQLAEQTS